MMSPAVWAAATVPPQPRCTVAVLPVEDHTSIVSRPMVMVAPATMEPRAKSTTTLVTDVFMVVVRRLTSGRLPESSRERAASTRSEASVAIAHLQAAGLGRLRAEPLATTTALGMGRPPAAGERRGGGSAPTAWTRRAAVWAQVNSLAIGARASLAPAQATS